MDYIEYGILISVVATGLMLFIVMSLNSRKTLNIISYTIALGVAGVLAFQISRLIAVNYISEATSTFNNIVGAFSPTLGKYVSSVTGLTSREINWFIFRRVMWSIIFLCAGGIVIYATMSPKRKKYHAAYEDYDSNGLSSTNDWGL